MRGETVRSVIDAAASRASAALDITVAGLFVLIIAITLAEVGGRYLFSHSFVWSDEAMRLLHLWMILLAAAKATHMRIELVVDRLPSGLQRAVVVGNRIVSVTMLAVLIYGSWLMMELTARDFYTGLRLPVSLAFLALFAGGSAWVLRLAFGLATRRRQ